MSNKNMSGDKKLQLLKTKIKYHLFVLEAAKYLFPHKSYSKEKYNANKLPFLWIIAEIDKLMEKDLGVKKKLFQK